MFIILVVCPSGQDINIKFFPVQAPHMTKKNAIFPISTDKFPPKMTQRVQIYKINI